MQSNLIFVHQDGMYLQIVMVYHQLSLTLDNKLFSVEFLFMEYAF